jgi:hypothetical protein
VLRRASCYKCTRLLYGWEKRQRKSLLFQTPIDISLVEEVFSDRFIAHCCMLRSKRGIVGHAEHVNGGWQHRFCVTNDDVLTVSPDIRKPSEAATQFIERNCWCALTRSLQSASDPFLPCSLFTTAIIGLVMAAPALAGDHLPSKGSILNKTKGKKGKGSAKTVHYSSSKTSSSSAGVKCSSSAWADAYADGKNGLAIACALPDLNTVMVSHSRLNTDVLMC